MRTFAPQLSEGLLFGFFRSTEADALLKQWGKNELAEKNKSKLRILFEQARVLGISYDAGCCYSHFFSAGCPALSPGSCSNCMLIVVPLFRCLRSVAFVAVVAENRRRSG